MGSERMNVNFQRPAQRQQNKYPKIICPQPTPHRFPFADRKMRRQQVGGDMFGPFLVRRYRPVREHRCKITGFQNTHAIGPNLIITVPPGFHKQEDRHEDRIDRDRKMRIVRRAENERKRSTGRDHRPVRRRVEPVRARCSNAGSRRGRKCTIAVLNSAGAAAFARSSPAMRLGFSDFAAAPRPQRSRKASGYVRGVNVFVRPRACPAEYRRSYQR